MGVLLLVVAIVGILVASPIGATIERDIRALICRIAGGDCSLDKAQTPEKCLTGKSTQKANASVLVAVVKVDKDSTLIREDFSDGSSRFTLLDNSQVAGELFAGAKGKVGKYGLDYSASADAGAKLAGARVFEFPDKKSADAFQRAVQATGGFDGIVRALSHSNDKIPIVGWKNPLGGLDDWVLDQLGVDDDRDLPTPKETYVEAQAFLSGKAAAGGGIGLDDAGIKGLLEAAGVVKVTTSGANKGDVEFSVEVSGNADASLTDAVFGVGAAGRVDAKFTATVTLDAQNGYRPDHLILKGTANAMGGATFAVEPKGNDLKAIAKELEKLSFSSSETAGKGVEFTADLDLKDPANRNAALGALLSGGNPAAVAGLIGRLNSDGTLSVDTYDITRSNTEGEVKVGLGVGLGAGGSSTSTNESGRHGWVRPPGGTFEPRVCKQPS